MLSTHRARLETSPEELGTMSKNNLRGITLREWIPHMGPPTKVISLKLFLDIVPSSSEDITRVMRGQQRRLSQNYRKRNGGNVIVYIIFWFRFIVNMFPALSAVFLFGRPFVCFVLVWLFIIWPCIRFWEMQRCCSGESARVRPLCPGFDSRTWRHMSVEFVVGSRPCYEGSSFERRHQ